MVKNDRFAEFQEECYEAIKQHASSEIYRKHVAITLNLQGVDSPIEALLALALKRTFLVAQWLRPFCEFTVHPQHSISKYRADFYITFTEIIEDYVAGGDNPDINGITTILRRSAKTCIVECDGHDYHERTKEQARRDKSRDRKLQALGHTVFHFTGSEIYADPMKCAVEVYKFLAGEPDQDFYCYLGWGYDA